MRKFYLFLNLLVLTLAVSAGQAFSQNRTIEINVSGNFRPVGSQGMILTSRAVINKPVIKVENSKSDYMVVSIPYKPQEIEDGAFATAVLFGPDGEVAFGELKMITDSISTKSFLNLPECSNDPQVAPSLAQQIGLLESLVDIRAARREGHHLRLKQTLDEAFAEKLNRLEKGFGFKYNEPLSEHLNSFELVDRLSRLSNAIQNYQAAKK